MELKPVLTATLLLISAMAYCNSDLPHLKKTGNTTQMIVDGKPFIMLAGELHNSSASSTEYMQPIWKKLSALNLNTVIGTVSWELVEPEEGKFDFKLVDDQIRDARAHNMRLVLIWFATWKNANASYAPLWVKSDLKRFPRVQLNGVNWDCLTPLGEESVAADARAFRALMRHIREVDAQHTVIMMQVENESGLTGRAAGSRDHSPMAEAVWNKPVPAELMSYLQAHKAGLLPELSSIWGAHGFRTSGTWPEVFGTDAYADEIFMAWYVADYIGKVAEAGKEELPIPMYVNAWIVQKPDELPGWYPSGGPVSRVMDIWHAAAPSIDLIAPDIYLPDFNGICASYTRSGNPLFIAESRASVASLFWTIGKHATLGYSPFGIEGLNEDHPLGDAYKTLQGMIPVITKYQLEGKVIAVEEGVEPTETVTFGGYKMEITFGGRPSPWNPPVERGPDHEPGCGLIVNTAPDEFLFVGTRMAVTFATDSPGPKVAAIAAIEEGRFDDGRWIPGRRINGDESSSGNELLLSGLGQVLKINLYRHD